MSSILESQIERAEKEWLEAWKRGPTRLRWSRVPLQVGDKAPDFELPDASANPIRLSSLWKGQPLLVLFWRHFGCSCGVDRGSRLKQEYDGYVKAGASVVIIAQGEPERAVAYSEKYQLPPVPILCDPQYRVYDAYGLLEGKPSQVLFDAPEEFLDRQYETGVKFQRDRHESGRPAVDSPWQMAGEFVIDAAGEVRLAYRYNFCEDYPDPRVLLAAIREAIKEGPKA
ncbi:MAG: AhpC/TSA family protein [Anaerolineales bacterium]|nr:AhpC/TSA family protein [Anaerolineales bacterium]